MVTNYFSVLLKEIKEDNKNKINQDSKKEKEEDSKNKISEISKKSETVIIYTSYH